METLMIIIALTFTPIPGQPGNVGISYEAKLGLTPTLENCRNIEQAFAADRGKNVIVICIESKEAPKKKPVRLQET